MYLHPARRRRDEHAATANPTTQYRDVYERLVLWDFPQEMRIGFQVALYLPVAVPRLAAVFTSTGYLQGHTMKRAYDTGLIIHEIICAGVDSPTGRTMVAHMTRAHARLGLRDDDMAQVLRSLVVEPTRMIDRFGWRRATSAEREATVLFYRELGQAMGIHDLPVTFEQCVHDDAAYLERETAPSPSSRDITAAITAVLAARVPRVGRPFVAPFLGSLVQPRIRNALGLSVPQFGAPAVSMLAAARQCVERARPPRTTPKFVPRSANRFYPSGYELADLGRRSAD